MRREFKPILFEEMKKNSRIILITADLGYKFFDEIRDKLPNQFYNIGAQENMMIGIGIGFAKMGYIPICYSITKFLLQRPYEMIDIYLNHDKIPVKILGGGRNSEYDIDGYTHYCGDDKKIMNIWSNIEAFWPNDVKELIDIIPKFLYNSKPSYLNLKR